VSLLVRDALILTQDEHRRQVRGHLYVEDGAIVSIGQEAPEADVVIKAQGRILMPGLINTHTHLAMGLLRGFGDDLPLMEWLSTRIWPAEDKITPERMRVGARLGLLELIRGGTTTFNDMYFHEPETADEADKAGIRGILGWGLSDVGKTPEGQANTRLAAVEQLMRKYRRHPRIRASPAPHAVYTCFDETFAKSAELCAKHEGILHTHLHETRDEVYETEAKRGKRPLKVLEDCGALGERTLLAHAGWLTKAEVGTISKHGAAVSHNPTSNMKLATGGVMPLPEILASGAPLGLGTDGAASNNRLDMFEAMKTTALIHKQARWDPKVADAQTVLDLATRGGADALGLGALVGSLEPGKRADLILIETRRAHMTPMFNPVSQVVYSAQSSDVALTVVEGQVLYDAEGHHTIDEHGTLREAQDVAESITAEDHHS
jgi:5-methylthioadenosine/S-adenosylhomocysteine deaminase